MEQLLILLLPLTGFFLLFCLLMVFNPKKENLEEKVKRLTAEKQNTDNTKKINRWKMNLTHLSKFAPRKWSKQLDSELQNCGIHLTGGEFIILQSFFLIFSFLLAFVFSSVSIVAFFLPLLVVILPRLYLTHALNKKLRQFNNQLADILLVLANSLKAGFSLLQAMEMASQEMPDPISSEIKTTLKEMTYGESTEVALQNFTKRVKSRDLDLMVTAILIQRQIGGNLAEILLNIHGTIQERLQIQGEIKSLTAQGKLSGYFVGLLPFIMGIIITMMQPTYLLALFNSTIGIIMVSAGLCSQVIGFIVINRIVNIKF